ncbi:MAG: ABC transporter ATP-binding protein [Gemmatimonadales bacterium]
MTQAITVRGLSKLFRVHHAWRPHSVHEAMTHGFRRMAPTETFWALRDIDLDVAPGAALGLIGDNGAGKSTLLRLLGGVGIPDAGTIQIAGRIGALLDLGAGFHGDLTGRENVMIGGVLNGLSRRQVRREFASIVDFAGLEESIDNPLRTFSTGMKMRLAFSVATVVEPEVLLVDEILGVGDVAFQHKCAQRIQDLRDCGSTLVVCSHDGATIREICDEAVWLEKGIVRRAGAAAEVMDAYEAATLPHA